MLKQPLWMPQILNELDSFDVGFLAATEKIRLIDNFDASFMVLKAVLDESRDVELWGPEAALLAKVLVSAWRKVGGKFLLKARDAFSLEGDISVDVNRINGLLEENGDLGKKLWNEVKKKVEAVINQTQVQALEFYLRQRDSQIAEKSEATDFTKEDWAKYVASSAQGHLETMLKGFPDRSVHDEIRRLAGIVDTNPLMRTVDRAALEKRILSLDKLGIGNLEGMADINVGRAWSWSGLELGSQQGITEYQIIAELDQKTCPVCERLHGRTFPLEKARGQMQDFMGKAHSAATLAAGMAFPRVSQVDNKSPEQIRAMAVSPPFHGSCRCQVVLLWGEVSNAVKAHPVASRFTDRAMGERYLQYEKEYASIFSQEGTLSSEALKDLYQKDAPDMYSVFLKWQSGTNLTLPTAVKVLASKMEGVPLIVKDKGILRLAVSWAEGKEDQYLRVRALNQAYMSRIGVVEETLYRGTDGATGRRLAGWIKEKELSPEVKLHDIVLELEENALVGYSSSSQVGHSFGSNLDGVTVIQKVKAADIVVHKNLLSELTLELRSEEEFIILGGKRRIPYSRVKTGS